MGGGGSEGIIYTNTNHCLQIGYRLMLYFSGLWKVLSDLVIESAFSGWHIKEPICYNVFSEGALNATSLSFRGTVFSFSLKNRRSNMWKSKIWRKNLITLRWGIILSIEFLHIHSLRYMYLAINCALLSWRPCWEILQLNCLFFIFICSLYL